MHVQLRTRVATAAPIPARVVRAWSGAVPIAPAFAAASVSAAFASGRFAGARIRLAAVRGRRKRTPAAIRLAAIRLASILRHRLRSIRKRSRATRPSRPITHSPIRTVIPLPVRCRSSSAGLAKVAGSRSRFCSRVTACTYRAEVALQHRLPQACRLLLERFGPRCGMGSSKTLCSTAVNR